MYKRVIFVLVIFVYFLGFNLVKAEVIINEVQINPTDGRFIELYNSDNSSVDLTDWYIQRKTENGTSFGSLVSKTYFQGKTIDAGGYFLISRNAMTNADIVFGSLTLTESNTIQIKNSNGDIVDVVGWGSCQENCVANNPTDGLSIQKISSNWIIASPTPRSLNQDSGSAGNNDDANDKEENSTTISSSDSSSDEEVIIDTVFKANILAPNLAFAGQPIEFNLDVKNGKYTYTSGKYFWNFGDGTSKEENIGFQKFTHTYYYPGEYNVYLEYSKNNGTFSPDAIAQMVIKVVPLTVSISKVGDYKDFFIELTNNSDSKIDISKWILSSSNKFFVFPKNTTIAGKKSLTVSGKISGFLVGDENNLKLAMPTGEVVFDYNTKSAPIKKVIEQTSLNKETNVSNIDKETENLMQNNLAATPVLSKPESIKDSYFFIGLVALLAICGGAVYFIRRKRSVIASIGDDFNILDE